MNLDNLAGLHESCRLLSPIRHDYATVPIQEGFNWSSCLVGAPFSRLYLVAFRSVRRRSADLDLLRKYDDRAYAEAVKRGGLLRYFKGEMNERRECVSFCLWESREQAVGASDGASHRRAAEIAARMYESYVLERYEVVKDGSSGDVAFWRLDGRTAQGGREA